MPDIQAQGPESNFKNARLNIPAFLPGIQEDLRAILLNDTLQYNVNIQKFENGYPIKTGAKFKNTLTPWQLLIEMADAYQKMDKKRIIALYNRQSKDKIEELLNGPQGGQFLISVKEAVESNLKILGGVRYKNGILAFTSDDKFGLHENYIVREKSYYRLSVLDDQSVTGWNIGLYFKFNPGPIKPINNLSIPASISLSDSVLVQMNTNEPGRWVAIFLNKAGSPVLYNVQDNGINDLDETPGVIKTYIKGSIFISKGEYRFFVESFNYPVQRVSDNFFRGAVSYPVKIY